MERCLSLLLFIELSFQWEPGEPLPVCNGKSFVSVAEDTIWDNKWMWHKVHHMP